MKTLNYIYILKNNIIEQKYVIKIYENQPFL